MQTVRKTLKQFIASIPPFDGWFAQIDKLREENTGLTVELERSTRELHRMHEKWNRLSSQLWQPPGHFYSPIPSFEDLKINETEIFEIPPAVRGVDLNEQQQLDLLNRFKEFYPDMPFTVEKASGRRYFFENPNYSYTDAIILYCMIRHLKPRKIVEVGSGYSSCAMLDVNELFFGNSIACTFIDPYPQLLRSIIKESDRERTRILGRKIQDVEVSIFRELEPSDILFIDSSHISKTGSDVNYILFKILPLIPAGVFIHFHDIFYPFEYPKDWAFEGRAWNEAYLLRAFIQYNEAFKIRFFSTFLIHRHREIFETDLPLCLKNTGGNLWLEKTCQNFELERLHDHREQRLRPLPRKIEPFRSEYAWVLGEGWHGPENDHCWMEHEAFIEMAGPNTPDEKLFIRGYSPHNAGAQVSLDIDDVRVGSAALDAAGVMAVEFPLPATAVGKPRITLHLFVDRIYKAPDDPRSLGLSVTAIEIA
jgi:hypothetical protein